MFLRLLCFASIAIQISGAFLSSPYLSRVGGAKNLASIRQNCVHARFPKRRTVLALRAQFSEEEKEQILADEAVLDELFDACEKGDCDKIKSWAEPDGRSVNMIRGDEVYRRAGYKIKDDSEGTSALHVAAMFGQVEAVSTLLELGANASRVTPEQNTPLHLAVIAGSKGVVEALVAAGGEVDALNEQGDSPKAMAEMMGKKELLELLA